MAFWIDTGTGTPTDPGTTAVINAVRQFATEGGLGVPPTIPGAEWFNMMTSEVLAVLQDAGITPNKASHTQLRDAIKQIVFNNAASLIGSAAGTADAITAVFSCVITSLTHGMRLYVRAAAANTTSTPTFTPVSGTIAAKTIVKGAGTALVAGDIAGAGHWLELQYDSTLNKWMLLNPATGVASLPAGAVIHVARSTPPAGYLKANGALVSRTTYAVLFAAIGTTFGVGDGSTTFALPDLRGEFIRGWDDSRGVDLNRTLGSFQQGSHITGDDGSNPSVQGIGNLLGQCNVDPPDGTARDIYYMSEGAIAMSYTTYWGRVRPRNIALLACIKF